MLKTPNVISDIDLHLSAMSVKQCSVLSSESQIVMLLLLQVTVGCYQFLTQQNGLRLHHTHLLIQIGYCTPVKSSKK